MQLLSLILEFVNLYFRLSGLDHPDLLGRGVGEIDDPAFDTQTAVRH